MKAAESSTEPCKDRILIVEDDRALRDGLAMNLRLVGYEVLTAVDGEEGMRLAFDARPTLIILDIMLPGWTGLEILEELRRRGERVPVLVLSARDTTSDKVDGLQQGADDYLTKPFDLPELLARVEVMLRRQRDEHREHPVRTVGVITLDPVRRQVSVQGRPVALSAREFDLLALLASAPGRVFSRDTILEKIWGWDYEGTARTVDNYVASLRKKLHPGKRGPKLIRTVPRVGYTLVEDDSY